MSVSTPEPAHLAILNAGLRVLVVDDLQTNRKLMATILEKQGAVVKQAANGREAVDAFRAAPFDLILMDVQMPVMNGREATRLIRAGGSSVPIVAVSSCVSLVERNDCFLAGVSDFLPKPFRHSGLLAVAAKHDRRGPNTPE